LEQEIEMTSMGTFRRWVGLALVVGTLAGCKSTDVMVWKPTYDPATYGTQALMRTVKDADRPKRDAIAAAKELAKRTLTESEP
jgi:hypothetical protein